MNRLFALLRQRCPVCLRGQVFTSLFGMHTHCPACGVKFERETGYFLNSMFIGYAAGFLILVPTAVLLAFIASQLNSNTLIQRGGGTGPVKPRQPDERSAMLRPVK
jgi:uncharacterized protein (DUF983 family)